jgi:hypothetical protein
MQKIILEKILIKNKILRMIIPLSKKLINATRRLF